ELERNFRDQNDVGAAGNTGVESNPTGIAAHDFDEHDAVVAFWGGVKAVDGFGGDDECGIEAEGDFGGVQIIVDGLGDTHNVHALAEKIARDMLRAVAAD